MITWHKLGRLQQTGDNQKKVQCERGGCLQCERGGSVITTLELEEPVWKQPLEEGQAPAKAGGLQGDKGHWTSHAEA